MSKENEIWQQFKSSTEMRLKMKIKQEVNEGNKKRSGKPQNNKFDLKNNVTNVRPTQPALKNNVTNVRPAQPALNNVRPAQPALNNNVTNVRPAQPALNNNVTNVRPVSNIINLLAKQGQISQSQLPKTTPNTQFKKHIITNKSTSPGQISDSQPPNTQSKKHVMTDKSTSPGQISDSQPPKTTPNTQSKKHIMTDKSTSPGQVSDSHPPKTTPNTQSKKHVMTNKSTSPGQRKKLMKKSVTQGQALEKGKFGEQEDVRKKTKTSPVCPAISIHDYCEMMGDKVLDEDMEQVLDGDKDMEQVLDGDKDMEQALYKQNTNNNSKRKWKHRKGKLRFSLIKAQLDHLKELVDNDGKSHDEDFHEVFGKERSGRVRCGGRTLTPTLLKKNQEMAAMAKMHDMHMASIKEDMEKKLEERDRDMERKLEETQKYFKSMLKSVLTQMNPSLDLDAIDAMMPLTPRDANSGFNSSTTMHIPNNE
ncbi:hypothetical protein ACFE04_026862 [Oxalis oulophora]